MQLIVSYLLHYSKKWVYLRVEQHTCCLILHQYTCGKNEPWCTHTCLKFNSYSSTETITKSCGKGCRLCIWAVDYVCGRGVLVHMCVCMSAHEDELSLRVPSHSFSSKYLQNMPWLLECVTRTSAFTRPTILLQASKCWEKAHTVPKK